MTGTKRTLFGGAAVSLALVTIAASGLPARAQDAAEVLDCTGLEGATLEDCLAAGPEPESQRVEPEPVELIDEEAVEASEPADTAGDETGVSEPDAGGQDLPAEPEADAVEAQTEGIETDASELPQETEPEVVEDGTVDMPEAIDSAGPEATGEAADLTAESAAEDIEAQTDAVEGDAPELEPESEAAAVGDEPIVLPETADEAEVEVQSEAEAEAEPRAVGETDAMDETEEARDEPAPVEAPEAVAEDGVVDGDAVEVTEAEPVDPEAVLSEEELQAAQRQSVEAAVQAALAAERQKSQAQQESERDDRMRILGAAAAGLAAGAILPEIGAMLVGQQGDRVILQEDDRLIVRRDETARFLQEGSDASVEYFADGLSLVTVTRPDGGRVLSWRDASGQVVRRVAVLPDGREITLFDGLEPEAEIRVTELPPIRREDQRRGFLSGASAEDLRSVLSAQPVAAVEDRFTLRQILANDRIRWLMPSLALDAVTFDTGSATLGAEAVQALDTMGRTLLAMVEDDPREVFLVEGHTDAVGSDIFNLALSDRRAETVATLLTSYYGVPPENLLVQGFGEQDLRVPTLAASRENRRVEVRRITPLLR
jgi:outer membrane protein OmpA-like peptidoglycan-associated protein